MQNRVGDAVCTPHAVAFAYDVAVVIAPSDSVMLRWHVARRVEELRGQLRAALAAASRDDRAASAGAHASAEAVHLGAAAIVGLKSTLAHENSVKSVPCGTESRWVGTLVRPYKSESLRLLRLRVKESTQKGGLSASLRGAARFISVCPNDSRGGENVFNLPVDKSVTSVNEDVIEARPCKGPSAFAPTSLPVN